MKSQIMYIENKTQGHDRGEAWIGKVDFSKTGQTVYFNNQALKKIKSGGVSGNFYDIETGDANYDKETGLLKWHLTIQSNGNTEKRFSYEVRYPKSQRINL